MTWKFSPPDLPRGPGGVISLPTELRSSDGSPSSTSPPVDLASALLAQAGEELGDPLDRNTSKAAQAEKMAVAADNHLGSRSDRALQNPVVSWVSLDRLYVIRWLDEAGDNTQLPVGFGQPFGRAFELVPEDAKGLRDDGFGDSKVDLTVNGEVEKHFRLASELQCADEDVGVSDDALHERWRDSRTACSTTASTSASLTLARR